MGLLADKDSGGVQFDAHREERWEIEEALRETWTTVRDSGMPFYFRL